MASLNRVLLMGNLTRDPQLSYLPSNTPVIEFGLALNRKYRKQDGSQGEEVCYVDCSMFGKRAETINKFFKKGDPIFVEGRLRYESWQAQDGSKRSRLRVFVENFEFVGGGRSGGGQGGGQQGQYGGGNSYNAPQNDGPAENEPFNPVDDIPF